MERVDCLIEIRWVSLRLALPAANAGRFLSVGRLLDTACVEVTPGGAASLGGAREGIDELRIANAELKVELQRVLGLNHHGRPIQRRYPSCNGER